jgi:hypothetical protein
MNTDKITYFITHPESVDITDLDSIIELKNKFPYSSTLHTLYLKTLANSNSLIFEEELKKSAIQINDRERLHGIIHLTKTVEIKPEIVIDVKSPETKIEVKELIVPAESPVKENTEKLVEITKEQPTLPVLKPINKIVEITKQAISVHSKSEKEKPDMAKIIEDIRLKAEAARHKQQLKDKESKQKSEISTEVNLDQTADTSISEVIEQVNDTIKVEEINPKQDLTSELKEVEIETPILKINTVEKETSTNEFIETEIDNSTLVIPQKEKLEIAPNRDKGEYTKSESPQKIQTKDGVDIDIMAQAMEVAFELDVDNIIREVNAPEKIETEVINEEISKEIPTLISSVKMEDLSFTDWLKAKQGKLKIETATSEKISEPEKIKLTKNEVNSLLDKFITEEPKMARPQKTFFSPVKNAKKSLDEDEVIVSETLAKIYWIQKNYDKAIKAYEQLSLRNPDKSAIFANQIKKIKQELNQK